MASQTKSKSGGSGQYITITGFGFTIPSDATINGIVVSFDGASGATGSITVGIYEYGSWVFGQTYHYITSGNWNAGTPSTGGATDAWNTGSEPGDINTSGFGIRTGGQSGNSFANVTITIYYTPAAPLVNLFFGNG